VAGLTPTELFDLCGRMRRMFPRVDGVQQLATEAERLSIAIRNGTHIAKAPIAAPIEPVVATKEGDSVVPTCKVCEARRKVLAAKQAKRRARRKGEGQ
jgi:hypothetical protein